ncbi:MAG: IS66 family insertion sequence element accessory protein TnpB [Parvibaculaceae bacterium]
MLQITPQMKILVAVEPADFRKGIDGLVRLCKDALGQDAFTGTVFVFRNRRGTAIKVLVYDGQGFWLCHKNHETEDTCLLLCTEFGLYADSQHFRAFGARNLAPEAHFTHSGRRVMPRQPSNSDPPRAAIRPV